MATSARLRRQFQSVFESVICSKQTVDVASLGDGVGATQSFTVSGAALGDFVMIAGSVDWAGITVTGYVSATNTVKVRFQNESTGTVDLASQSIYIAVLRPSAQLFK